MSTALGPVQVNSANQQATLSGTSLGIRGKILIGFAVLTIILLIAITVVLVQVNMTKGFAGRVINTDLPLYNASYDLDVNISQSRYAILGYIVTHNPMYKTDLEFAWRNIKRLEATIDNYTKSDTTSNAQAWSNIKLMLDQLKTEQYKIIDVLLTSQNQGTIAAYVNTNLATLSNKILDILDGPTNVNGERVGGIFDTQYQALQEGTQKIIIDVNNVQIVVYILLITSLIFSVAVAFITANKILRPLRNAIDIAKKIAAGERQLAITVTSNDETGELLIALGAMQQSILENEKKLQHSELHTRQLFEKIVTTANAFSKHSSNVAAGNLTNRITVDTQDEMSQLGNDLNSMTDSLATITKKISESCHNMVTTITEVKHAIGVQSSGASEQASSINEITVSVEEIEKSSNQTIEKARTLGEVAERTRAKGQMGLEAVEQSVLGMKAVRDKVQTIAQTILELSNQTQQVGEITAVVNTLAQQSKMLALNASIEAAKAGEAGKGFAVVAAEVKNLAEQSEQSTTQVQKILEDIRRATEKAVMATEEGTKGVDLGTGLVEQTGEAVRSLSDVIHETTIASQQIEAAIRQEGVGIEQITAGMNEINQVTSSFVESVKQTTEAIDNLASIAKNLKEYTDIYKI